MTSKKTQVSANPQAPEVYADRAGGVSIRGNVARVTLVSERTVGDPATPEPVVAGHVAMPIRGFLQLYGQMQSVVRQMEESGLLKAPDSAEKKASAPKTKAPARSRKAAAKRSAKSTKS